MTSLNCPFPLLQPQCQVEVNTRCVSMCLNDIYFSVGGTAGAIVTCPLEVVKTRLQSSNSGFGTTLKVGAVEAVRVDSVEAVNHLTSATKTGGKVSHVVYR